MARYCPKCYVAIDAEDVICQNCGEILKPELVDEDGNPIQEPTAEAFNTITSSQPEGPITEELAPQGQEEAPKDEDDSQEAPEAIPTVAVAPVAQTADNMAPVISLGEWVWTILLTCIPLVNIIMLIIWAATGDTNPNKKTFAQAQLIWMGVGIAISLVFSFSIAAIVASIVGSMA